MSTGLGHGQDQQAAADADPYANAVIGVLAGDFPDLRDPTTAADVRQAIHAHTHPRDFRTLEIVIDDPFTANWRLIAAPHDRRRVHLACWKLARSDADAERWARLNKALDAIPVEEG